MTVSVQYKIEISEVLPGVFSAHASAAFAKHRQVLTNNKISPERKILSPWDAKILKRNREAPNGHISWQPEPFRNTRTASSLVFCCAQKTSGISLWQPFPLRFTGLFFLKLSLWALKLQFIEVRRKFSMKIFCSISEMVDRESTFFKISFSSERFFGQLEHRFDNPGDEIWWKF